MSPPQSHPHPHPHPSHDMELSPILSGTMRAFDDPPFVSLEPSPGPGPGPSLGPGPIPGTVADPMMQPYYGHLPDNLSHYTDDEEDHLHRYPNPPAPPPPPPAELVRARVSFDRLPAANERSQRNGDFSNPRDWRLYLTERNELSITLPVVIDFSVDHGQPEDCSWWASLSQVNYLVPPRPGANYTGGPSEAASYGPPDPLLDEGMISATKQREILLKVLFALPKEYVSRRNLKCKLEVTVNGIEVTGLPDTIQVRCSRQERRDEGKKRASDSNSLDSQELPKAKRARGRPQSTAAAAAAPTTAAASASALMGAASALAGLISTSSGLPGAAAAASAAAVSALPFASLSSALAPLQPDAHQAAQVGRPLATERDEAKLLAMISDPFHFDPDLVVLLSQRHFRDLAARQAFDLLFKTHLGALGTAWTCVHILRVLELIGGHAEVLLPTSWQESPAPYPSPMHVLAKCPRPDLVDALLSYLAPPTVPTPPTRPCADVHTGRALMACATCRASASFRALSHANNSAYLPIHAAARHTNTVFVRHHLRLVGAHRTLLVPNDKDWGNVFHTVCGAMSAVHWLDEVWRTVLLGDEVRRVVGMALAMRNSYGSTPLDMARWQVEKRSGAGAGADVQVRTYDWIAERIGVPKWAVAKHQSGASVPGAPAPAQGRVQGFAAGPANGAVQAYFAQFHPGTAARASGPAVAPAAPATQSQQGPPPARTVGQGSALAVPASTGQRPGQASGPAPAAPAPSHSGPVQGQQANGSDQDSSAQSSVQGSSPGSTQGSPTLSAASASGLSQGSFSLKTVGQ